MAKEEKMEKAKTISLEQDVRWIEAIQWERKFQDRKHGGVKKHPHTVGEWLLIIESELLEAKEAWVCGGGDLGALREILQVASVCVACMQQHGVVER
jgi:hypothetical protein